MGVLSIRWMKATEKIGKGYKFMVFPEATRSPKGEGTKDTYSRAIAELEVIVAEIEAGATDVDLLAEKTKRAFYLIGLCRAKLSQTESEVKAVLQKIEEGPDTAADATTGHDLDL